MGKRKHGTKRNGKQTVKSVQNGNGRQEERSASGAPRSGALEGASAIGEAVREGAGTVSALARDAQQSAREAGQSAFDFMKRNPVPLALAGVGLACTGAGLAFWLLGDRAAIKDALRSRSVGMGADGESMQDGPPVRYAALARAASGTRSLATQAQRSFEEAAHVASDRAQQMARVATTQGQRLATVAEQGFREHPLAVGAALFAVGTAIGASLPSTVREARWLGEHRDALVDRARTAARGAVRKVEALASAAAE